MLCCREKEEGPIADEKPCIKRCRPLSFRPPFSSLCLWLDGIPRASPLCRSGFRSIVTQQHPLPPSLQPTLIRACQQLQAELLKRPYGDAVFEALRRTIDEEEAVVVGDEEGRDAGGAAGIPGARSGGGVGGLSAGDKVWSRAAAGSGGGGSGSEEEEDDRVEGERVEAAARRTALWAVARGVRKELPASVRVSVRFCRRC